MYEINDGTLAVLSKNDGRTEILEDSNTYVIEEKSYNIMDHSCRFFGSSYSGREEGSQNILGGLRYKVPIIVEESKNLIFFPTESPNNTDCCWISLKKIKNYSKSDQNTKITFINDSEIILPISFRTIENQILRATRLESIIQNRKKN